MKNAKETEYNIPISNTSDDQKTPPLIMYPENIANKDVSE
jgi:hypothetical protein